MEPRKKAIIDALSAWIRQRPGLEPGNYDRAGYRSESRRIARDGREARTLLAVVRWRDGITADDLIEAAKGAFSGRLTIDLEDYTPDKGSAMATRADIEYMTGQYWPTEYRRAVCAVLASALWKYTREKAMPAPKGYRVESWTQLGKGRTLHTVRDTREQAESELKTLGGDSYGSVNEVYLWGRFMSAGDWLRARFRREFGRGIASRWFS